MKDLKAIISLLFIVFILNVSYAQDWANLNRYRNENTNIGLPKSGENRVVFIGNSITELWGSTFPKFFSDNGYVNRGISGQTSPQLLVRFRADVINLKPAVVIILAGTNDIAGNTGPSTLEMIADNIFSMAELAKSNGIKVILCSVLPVYDYPWKPGLNPAEKIAELNKMIKNYADSKGMVYLDYYLSLKDNRNGMRAEYSKDGVHPNEAGFKVMMPLCDQAIKKSLNQ